jgi:hypothetical protein
MKQKDHTKTVSEVIHIVWIISYNKLKWKIKETMTIQVLFNYIKQMAMNYLEAIDLNS